MWSWSRVVDLLKGRRAQQAEDFNRELRAHLDLEAEEQQEACHSSEEARYAARRAFGNTTLVREEVREVWGWTWVERLIQDSRIGLRQFRKNPGFTGVAILTLAQGIGANTAIFTLVHAVMTQSLPVANPDQLYSLGDTKLCCDTTTSKIFETTSPSIPIRFTSTSATIRRSFLNLPRFRPGCRVSASAEAEFPAPRNRSSESLCPGIIFAFRRGRFCWAHHYNGR